ncbi:MAG TPA: hypothetical protein VGQ83_07065 [Polyangia bacterium]
MRTLALVAVIASVCACSSRPTPNDQQARVRNQPPSSCTQADFNRCAAPAIAPCADGSEPVIDYGADCCAIYSCQPACAAPQACPMQPAPNCGGAQLQVGTSLSDCCPVYRCNGGCKAANFDEAARTACPAAVPYCGAGIQPIVIGETGDCCPVYQCPPCSLAPPDAGAAPDPMSPAGEAAAYCGCSYPVCKTGEQLVCTGSGQCGAPCACQPVAANCTTDADCGANMYCDTASRDLTPPGCDPASGACPGTGGGVCVAVVQAGCRADTECPGGQRCDLTCYGSGCAPTSTAGVQCCDPATDATCTCDANGTCTSQACTGLCVPASTCTMPAPAAACPAPAMPCADPVVVSLDPTTCCPIYQCPSNCAVRNGGTTCAVPGCYCGVQVGLDADCCPIIECPAIPPSGQCPAPCGTDAACAAGQTCVAGFCA